MTVNLNKKILIASELQSSAMGLFFQELGYELTDKFVDGDYYAFAVDSVCPEVLTVPRVQLSRKIDEKIASNVRGLIDPAYFRNDQGRQLLKAHFDDAQELNLIERYSQNLKTIYNLKLQEYLNLGFFVDSIVVEAYRGKFDITSLRNYLNTALNFAFKKIEFNVDIHPIEVAYSHDGEAFAVQISLDVESFGGKEEIKGIFDQLAFGTNYFDIAYHSHSNKLILSSLLFRDVKMKSTHSYFFTEVTRRAVHDGEVLTSLYSGLMIKEELPYVTPIGMKDESTRNKEAIAKRFALFIRNTRKKEENKKNIEFTDIDSYLQHYPRQKTVDEIDDEIKNLTFKILKDDEVYQGMREYIQKISGTNLNDEILEFQRMLKSKSLEGIEEISVIKNTGSLDTVPYNVKAWIQDEEEVQKISGNPELTNEEIWEIKKLKLNEKIQSEVTRIRGEGKNIVLDDLVRVAGAELKVDEDQIRPVVEYLVEEVVTSEIAKNKKLEEVFSLGLLNNTTPIVETPKDELKEKLQDQNARMKKIMEQMKHELIKLQNEKKELETINVQQPKIDPDEKLKVALGMAMKNIKTKDRFIEKIRHDVDGNLKMKDERIMQLETKIEEMRVEHARSKGTANAETIEFLETENKSLSARLGLANQKAQNDAESNGNASQADIEKYEKEIDALKLSVTMAQTLIERLKHDKHQAEVRFLDEKAELSRELEERSKALATAVKGEPTSKSDPQIISLTNEKKALEEKLKAQSMELKKAEQKLKFANSQLDSANSHTKKDNKANVKSNEAYAKQLDLMNVRVESTTAEIAEKRKELHKVKQENAQMAVKITELEKKVALWEKKAS